MKEKVLVIEDEQMIFDCYVEKLSSLFELELADSIELAQEKLFAHKYDFVILDLMINGREATSLLKLINEEQTKVVLCSAVSSHNVFKIQAELLNKIDHFVEKPEFDNLFNYFNQAIGISNTVKEMSPN